MAKAAPFFMQFDLDRLTSAERAEIERLFRELDEARSKENARKGFLPFVKKMWPDFIEGYHHQRIADLFDDVLNGKRKRIIINMPPRHTKSEFASIYLPAYFLGRFPNKKIIQASHTGELAVGFGRKVRDLVGRDDFRHIFPGVDLSADSKAAGRWATNKGGEYFAIGVGGALAGKGADLLVIDDPHALALGTPIPTPEGFVNIEDLKVGDYVFGPDGEPTKVVAKSDVWHDRDLYSVTTSDNQEILCDGGHLWGINSDTCLARARVDPYAARYLAEWPKMNRPIIPRHQAVNYPKVDLPIDPWVLGAWLGDGTSSSGRITAHPDDQAYMMEEFRKAGYRVGGVTKDGYTFNVYGLMPELRELGVLNNKHIPEAYMTASIDQRMSLLQGLVDTDGNVTKNGQCAFHNADEGLVRGVVELLHSLGVKAQMRTYHDERGRWGSAKPKHRVVFKLQDAARMPRKAIYTRTPMDKLSRSIEVEKTGQKGSVQCITVEREDGLFLAGRGYVVTHNSEQDAIQAIGNPEVYDKVMEWYEGGPRQRLQPGGAIILVMTRWATRDLTAQLLKKEKDKGADKWEVVEFPAILPNNEPVWPQFWKLEELLRTKASIPVSKWNAQYQQHPTSEEGSLIKREYWQDWTEEKAPNCEIIIQSWDTAFSKGTRADYSAVTTWGVFQNQKTNVANIILLDAEKGKWEFPELKRKALENYRRWKPEICLIEARAAGHPLIFELRAMGLPIQDVKVGRGSGGMSNDKISRVNAVSDIFASKHVWAPRARLFAQEVIEECQAFPVGDHDDYVDTVSQALARFRRGGWVGSVLDEEDKYVEHDYEQSDYY